MGANAGTAVPTYASGDVLTAANLNLTNSGAPVFADTSARDGAFGSGKKTLAEGQLCYLEDANVVQYYDGSSWATVGPSTSAVIQVKSTTKIDVFSTTSTSLVDVTGLSVSITPTSASNNVLVIATVSGSTTNNADAGSSGFVIVRDSTAIAQNTSLTIDLTGQITNRNLGSTAFSSNSAATYLDSPATTSATTYKIQAKTGGTNTIYINREPDGTVGTVSSITVFEVTP
jgi:hypothetical protein